MVNNAPPIIAVTEGNTVNATRNGSTVNHTVSVDGEVVGWVVEHRSFDGWSIWGYDLDVMFDSLDDAVRGLVEYL